MGKWNKFKTEFLSNAWGKHELLNWRALHSETIYSMLFQMYLVSVKENDLFSCMLFQKCNLTSGSRMLETIGIIQTAIIVS